MKVLEFSPESRVDLAEIAALYAKHSERMAKRILKSILTRCRTLRGNPMIGRPRPELGSGFRSVPSGDHIVYYVPISKGVRILRIIHGARDITPPDFA